MIFVTVGTNEARFDRLLVAIGGLGGSERIVAQHGASAVRPARAECVDFLAFDELTELVHEARAVVSHAGVGSILVALSAGKRPIVVPRLKRHGEAVDDHQVALAIRLAAAGLVTVVHEPGRELESALASSALALEQRDRPRALLEELRSFLTSACAPDA